MLCPDHFLQPPTQGIVLALTPVQHRKRPVYQCLSQGAIAPFADTRQTRFVTTGILPWRESRPGCQLPAIAKLLAITDRRNHDQHHYQQGVGNRANGFAFEGKGSLQMLFIGPNGLGQLSGCFAGLEGRKPQRAIEAKVVGKAAEGR